MNVRENIAFPLKMAKVLGLEIKNRVGEVAVMLNMEDLLDAKPKELSYLSLLF